MDILFFYLVALIAVVSGFLVVSCKNPVNSAISLVMTFVCLATFYVMLKAPFMAAIQILVYAGAIMVLIIFVIMLLNLGTVTRTKTSHAVAGGAVLGTLILVQLMTLLGRGEPTMAVGEITNEVVQSAGHTELIGAALFTEFLLPFEITSILLLVAMIGAVVLAKKTV